MYVFVQGKETAEEEDEVAVGMEKGFMDEFFEQVCFSHSPDVSFYLFLSDTDSHAPTNLSPTVNVFTIQIRCTRTSH